ncbi:MAG: LiaF transmembrane domain-containing protein [Adhaeribacter sp.]
MQHTPTPRSNSGKVMAGFILISIGAILLLHRLDLFFFPRWLFSWPMILIVVGLFIGAKHQYRNPAWFILVGIGTIFLFDRFYPFMNLSRYLWPLMFILFGLYMIFGRNRHNRINNWPRLNETNPGAGPAGPGGFNGTSDSPDSPFTGNSTTSDYRGNAYNTTGPSGNFSGTAYTSDFLSSTSVFGGVKKNIISKNFQGGEIVTFLGGAEINLSQADIQGRVILDVTQVLGGTKIIVPPHWDVISEVAAVFGGVEDKRFLQAGVIDHNKILIIRGTSLLGGIDIRSY